MGKNSRFIILKAVNWDVIRATEEVAHANTGCEDITPRFYLLSLINKMAVYVFSMCSGCLQTVPLGSWPILWNIALWWYSKYGCCEQLPKIQWFSRYHCLESYCIRYQGYNPFPMMQFSLSNLKCNDHIMSIVSKPNWFNLVIFSLALDQDLAAVLTLLCFI